MGFLVLINDDKKTSCWYINVCIVAFNINRFCFVVETACSECGWYPHFNKDGTFACTSKK